MLRDAAGFALDDIRPAQGIEQAGLAVVDMAHDRNHCRTRLERFGRIDIGFLGDVDIGFGNLLDIVAELVDQQFRSVLVDRLVDGDHHVEIEEFLDEVGTLFAHALGQFANRDRLGDDDIADLLFARLRRAALHPAFLLARTLERGERTGAATFVLVERLVDGQLARTTLVDRLGTACRLFFLLLALGLLGLGARNRGEPARRRRRRAARILGGRCFLGGRFFSHFRRCFGSGLVRSGRLLGRLFLGLALVFGALLLVFGSLAGLLFLALARILGLPQAIFLGLALEPRDAFLRRFVSGRGLFLRRSLFGNRSRSRGRLGRGRRRRGCRLCGRRGFAGLHELTAALHLDRDLVGAAVAEGLLDLARLRTLQGQRLAGWFLFVVAHSCSFLFFISFNSSSARGVARPSAAGRSCPK